MKNIKMEFSIDELNLILEALGQLPFARVYALIARIQEEAHQQIHAVGPNGGEPASAGASAGASEG